MQIPKSLESSWKQVSEKGSISKDDYKVLLRNAKTLSDDGKSVNKEVVDFLKGLSSQFETSTKNASIPVASVISFSEDIHSSNVSQRAIGDIPESLKAAWKGISSDNKITKDEYSSLLKFAAAPENKALDQVEQDFLKNIQVLILSSKDVEINIVDGKVAENTEKLAVSEPIQPSVTKKDSNTLEDPTIDNLNEIKALLAKIGDDPDLAPLKGIVDKRIDNSNKLKDFSNKINEASASVKDNNDSQKLQSTKSDLQKAYSNLGELKDLDQPKALFQNVIAQVDAQLSKIADKPVTIQKPVKVDKAQSKKTITKTETKSNIPFVESSTKVPDALKSDWKNISADNKITGDEFNNMLGNMKETVSSRPDKALLPDEEAFLKDLSKKINSAEGELILKKASNPKQTTEIKTPFGILPNSLKSKWNELLAKGIINESGFEELKLAAAPHKLNSEIDQKEKDFLLNLLKQINNNGGELKLTK